MARIRSVTGRRQILLDQGWTLTLSAPGGSDGRLDHGAESIPAPVPGTAAQALQAAGLWSADDPAPLHDRDVVYRTRLTGHGPHTLRFRGLATIAEVRLDGERILTSDSMYLAHEVPVTLNGEAELSIRFHALHPVLAAKKGRARWRPKLAEPAGLRFVRTTLLGHMPGWCPSIHAVGPFRPVELVEETGPCRVLGADLRSGYDGRDGHLSLRLTVEGAAAGTTGTVEVAGLTAPLAFDGVDGFSADLTLPGVEPWWPHTHGEPVLHGVTARIGLQGHMAEIDLGRVGFRSLAVDRGPDGNGFALLVNGVRVFCRGGCWVPVDLVGLSSDRASYEPELRRMRDAGANMVRVGGTMLYEGDAFFELCDELGILIWQDAMFANFDYPTDPAFLDSVRAEIAQLLDRTQASPSLAVLCGGSEMEQQAAMLGLPRASWSQPALTAVIAEEVTARRPDLIRVANSPSGGALPFIANAGVTHYYGVGAYLRPLEDARRADVRFASECLAFANLGEDDPLGVPALHHPRWKERVPRDPGASWDFEDVREHYLEALYAVDPRRLRYEDPDRYRRLSRAVTGEVMQAVFDEWRRAGSGCAGGLVWQWRDPWPSGGWGAGWGVVAADGTPKPAWHALKRAFRPLRVILTDEGVNGLAVHLVNDTARPVEALLRLTAWRDGAIPVLKAERPVTLPASGAAMLAAAELSDRFFDTTYAYRFGPISHDVVTAQLLSAERDAEPIDESHYFPKGRSLPRSDLGLTAVVEERGEDWALRIATARFACSVHVEDERFQAQDAWFHLPPGIERVVRLRPRAGSGVTDGMASAGRPVPNGEVHALNALAPVRYRGNA